MHYAEVTIECDENKSQGMIEVSNDAFAWLKEVYGPNTCEWPVFDNFRHAAIRGVKYALANSITIIDSLHMTVLIKKINVSPADTTDSCVAFAACYATWKALELTPSIEPRFQGPEIFFDDAPNS